MPADVRKVYISSYKFRGTEGSLTLEVIVKDKEEKTVFAQNYKQVDRTERKYGVTFKRDSK